MLRTKFRVVIAIAVLALLPAAKSLAGDKVTFGIGVDPTFIQVLVAEEKGFFQQNGIDASVKTFGFGALTLDAVLAGQTDVAMATELPSISASVRGGAVVQVAAFYKAPNYNAAVVRKNIDNVQDLRGKSIAIKKNTASEYMLYQLLKKHGMSLNDVDAKNVAPSEMIPAFDRGDVDGFVVWEPWPTKGIEIVKDSKVLARGGDDGGIYTMTSLLIFSDALANDHDKASRVLKSLVMADDFIAKHPEYAIKLAAKKLNLTEDLAKIALDRVNFRIELTQELVGWQKEAAGWLQDAGVIASPPNWDKFINASILKGIAPERVDF